MSQLLHHPEVVELVRLALREDRVDQDVTTLALVPAGARGLGRLVARAPGVLAGTFLLEEGSPLFENFPGLTCSLERTDGDLLAPGDTVALLEGPGRALLSIERTILNLLQRSSGIATLTARFVDAVRGTQARILETRKTCPGWRVLDKHAVACGGGMNHRVHLADQVLIKENHLAFMDAGGRTPQAITQAVAQALATAPEGMPLAVEVETAEELEAALSTDASIILLDDFELDDVARAVKQRDAAGTGHRLEASGGVALESVRALAETGVDRISVGALTHSASALDLAMETRPVQET